MEELLVVAAVVILIGSGCGYVAMARIAKLARRIRELEARPAAAPAAPPVAATPVYLAATPAPRAAALPPPTLVSALATSASPPPAPSRPFAPPPPPPAPLPVAARQRWGSFEERLGKRWITWVGSLALFIAAALFVKLSIDRGWLGPAARIILAAGFGTSLLLAGERFARRALPALAQGLTGAGLAVLYAAIVAGLSLYRLYPQELAFVMLVAVTVGGVVLAIRHDALPLAMLAVLGGFLSPVMVSTGHDARDALFTYLTLLDLGVLAIAMYKRWRPLELLAFAGTLILFGGWFAEYYQPAARLPTLAWVLVLHAIFLVLPFVHHLRRRIAMDGAGILAALAAAAVTFGAAQRILPHEHHALGLVSLAMAAAYVMLGSLARRRLPRDARASLVFVSLAMFFATLAVPLHLRHHGITLAWAAEGLPLLYLGYRYRYFPVRLAGFVVLALAATHLLGVSRPFGGATAVPFFNAAFASAMFVPLAAAAYALLHYRRRSIGDGRDRLLQIGSAIAAGVLALVVIHLELDRALDLRGLAHAARAAVVPLWSLGAIAFLVAGTRLSSASARAASIAATIVAVVLAVIAYQHGDPTSTALYLNVRFLAALTAVAALFATAAALRRRGLSSSPSSSSSSVNRRLATVTGYAGIAVFWLLVSVETYGHYSRAAAITTASHEVAQMALSLVWSAFAIALVALGFRTRTPSLRLAGLALFGLTAAKLVLIDLGGAGQTLRVLSFFVLGVLMIGASYLYHRLARRLAGASDAGDP